MLLEVNHPEKNDWKAMQKKHTCDVIVLNPVAAKGNVAELKVSKCAVLGMGDRL